jgi:hypothetical protein
MTKRHTCSIFLQARLPIPVSTIRMIKKIMLNQSGSLNFGKTILPDHENGEDACGF